MTEKISYILIVGLLRGLAFFPLKALYLLSDVLYFFVYRLWGYRKKVVRENLHNAFPEQSERQLLRIERKFYRHLCDLIVETVKLLHISDRELQERIEVRNTDIVNSCAEEGVPVILFLGHYGNWEWCPAVSMACDKTILGGEIYKPLSNKAMDRVMRTIRSRFGTQLIPHRSAYRVLMEMSARKQPFAVAFISDQRPEKSMTPHQTLFLNQKTNYVTGGEKIGRRIGARFVYVDIEKTGRGHYRLSLVPVEADPQSSSEYPCTEAYLRLLEQTIRRQPEYWLWSHKRWYYMTEK